MNNCDPKNERPANPAVAVDGRDLKAVLLRVLDWSRTRSYAGYSKHDALNSPFLNACALGIPFLRLVVTQVVMRAPVNIRPLLGVPTGRNPKGVGLFANAYLDLAAATEAEAEKSIYIEQAESLLTWLIHHASPNAPASEFLAGLFPSLEGTAPFARASDRLKGLGWGYHYPWQDAGFFQPRHYPNRVVTSWIGFAFLRAFEVTGERRYLEVCRDIASFLTDNPRVLYEDADQLCLSYVPLTHIEWAVMDVSALTAAFLARYASALERTAGIPARDQTDRLRALARRLMAFVVDKQTDYGAWFYTWPATDSHIKHDNYHTAIILDCLADYMAYANDPKWEEAYKRGLAYYRSALFTPEGAPRWMNDRTWPHDIHGAASGILTFSRAARYAEATGGAHMAWADHILSWTLRNLYDERGYFNYQMGRFTKKRFCLMRWCNAWMCRAMAQRLLCAGKDANHTL